MAVVFGTDGKDFYHLAGDGRTAPPGYTDIVFNPGDLLAALSGDDILIGTNAGNRYGGYDGYDTLDYSDFDQGVILDEQTGGIYTLGGGLIGTFAATSGVEEFLGSAFNDVMESAIGGGDAAAWRGRGGNDLLIAGANAETLDGGADNDTVSYANSAAGVTVDLGLSGPQVSAGGASGDTLTDIENLKGSVFADALTGNAGDNILNDGGFGGNDTLTGGGGNDSYSVYNAGAVIVELGGEGNDRVSAGVDYVLAGGVSVEYLNTTSVHATYAVNLTGNELGQLVRGNDGANVLDGAGGNDWLFGMGGADVFSFSTALGAGNVDRIADFSVADDKIQLDSAIFTALGIGVLDASAFKDNFLGSRDADDRIFYNSNTGSLFYDADGSGADFAAIKFASLASGLGLSAADFTVI